MLVDIGGFFMAYIITNKQYFFHTDFGVIQFLFKLTFFNPKTKRKTYTYLLESEYLEDPFFIHHTITLIHLSR